MTLHVARVRFSFDPVIAEAKRRAWQRRLLLAIVVALMLGGAAGATVALRSPRGAGSSPASPSGRPNAQNNATVLASFPQYGLAFRYPSAWVRQDCPFGTTMTSSVTVLTTIRPRPACTRTLSLVGVVPRVLGKNGVFVWWDEASWPDEKVTRPNARIGGQAARVEIFRPEAPAWRRLCGLIAGQRVVDATIQEPSGPGLLITMAACLRGPNFGRNTAAVRKMLASVRFSR